MKKRLAKSDFMMAYMIIITLACTIGGFFFGAFYMKTEIESAQAAALEAEQREAEKEQMLKEHKLYNEQDFVRFHYAVLAPVRELQNAHFGTIDMWADLDAKGQEEALKELEKAAKETLKLLEKDVLLPTSPLLVQAHSNFTEGVRTYLARMEQVRTAQNSNALSVQEVASHFASPGENWAKAQEELYLSLANWEASYVTRQAIPQEAPETVTIAQWKQYPFHYRTYLSAVSMTREGQWTAFYPEDLATRIDNLLASSDAATIGVQDISGAVRLLYATDAIQPGDFTHLRKKIHPELKAPEIPIYN
ncbi:hypothetical protein ACAF76_012200 [Brevibacillus sp. TJ4]|uniref:hypothetical protein n=1 Tax=Brevibacillus sp. TJ4 TaxID=3234853 RepID=UPI0037D5199C